MKSYQSFMVSQEKKSTHRGKVSWNMKNDIVVELLNQNTMCVASHFTLDFSRTSLMCVQTEHSTHAMSWVVKKIYDLLPCSSIYWKLSWTIRQHGTHQVTHNRNLIDYKNTSGNAQHQRSQSWSIYVSPPHRLYFMCTKPESTRDKLLTNVISVLR